MSQRIVRRAGATVAGLLLVGGSLAGANELIHAAGHPVISAGAQTPLTTVYVPQPVTTDAQGPTADASVPSSDYAVAPSGGSALASTGDAAESAGGSAAVSPANTAAPSGGFPTPPTTVYVPMPPKVYVQQPGGSRVVNNYVCTIQTPDGQRQLGRNTRPVGGINPKGPRVSSGAGSSSAPSTPAVDRDHVR